MRERRADEGTRRRSGEVESEHGAEGERRGLHPDVHDAEPENLEGQGDEAGESVERQPEAEGLAVSGRVRAFAAACDSLRLLDRCSPGPVGVGRSRRVEIRLLHRRLAPVGHEEPVHGQGARRGQEVQRGGNPGGPTKSHVPHEDPGSEPRPHCRSQHIDAVEESHRAPSLVGPAQQRADEERQ